MRLQAIKRYGSILTIGLGLAIALNSFQAISESSAGSQFIPALDSFDSANTSSLVTKPKTGELIGTLEIARLKRVIPIYEGTGDKELKKGAGHYAKSVLPGLSDNSVIAGHRDSFFAKFGSLKVGDLLVVNTNYGKFVYHIDSFRIVKANNRTVIVPTDDARLTLSTCYPFYFIGNAPKRFIVNASLLSNS
jgi:sortase A